LEEDRLEAARRGGSRRTLPLPLVVPLEATEVRGLLGSLLVALLQGALEPATARAAGYLLQVDRQVAERESLEKRIAALEGLVQSPQGRRNGSR